MTHRVQPESDPANRSRPCDLLVVGGTVWSGGRLPYGADAIAVSHGRIRAVGPWQELRGLAGPGTRVVEARGQFVMPGFIDSHVHFLAGGRGLSRLRLRTAASRAVFAQAVAEHVGHAAPGEWVRGGEWDHQLWGGALPHRDWVDPVSPDNPVWVTRLDLHMGLANSAALERAGIDESTPAVRGGEIVRDAEGRPTGILKDEAMQLVAAVLPAPTDEDQDRALEAAAAHALSLGITQVHDMQGWEDLAVYRRARDRGALPLRVYSVVPMRTWRRMSSFIEREGRGDDRLWWGGLKAFVDGSLGSMTAWFHDPYAECPGSTGLVVTDLAELRESIRGLDRAGLHAIVHAIGDRAVDWLLDTYREVASGHGPRDRRFRIEHAQHLSPGASRRFASERVIASVQPYHAIDDGRWAERALGPARLHSTYAFRSLLAEGAHVAFGSDWTVAPLDPIQGIYAAVTRRTLDGAHPGGWIPEQRISVEEALRAYTVAGAHGGFTDGRTGALALGAHADLVCLDQNPLTMSSVELASIRVVRTMVEGEIVFERGA